MQPIKPIVTLDPENRLPIRRYQYVTVVFEKADFDTAISHVLNPVNPEEVMYEVVRLSGPAVIYQDMSPDRKPWQRKYIWLRASAPVGAVLLLELPAQREELLGQLPQPVAEDVTVTADVEKKRAFGITVDGGALTLTTGIKGFIRVPVDGFIEKVTVLSTDAAITSGSVVMDVWKDTFANYAPTIADSIVALAPPTLSSATASEDAVLTGWTRAFSAGDVFGFSIVSVSNLKRITVVIDYTPQ